MYRFEWEAWNNDLVMFVLVKLLKIFSFVQFQIGLYSAVAEMELIILTAKGDPSDLKRTMLMQTTFEVFELYNA